MRKSILILATAISFSATSGCLDGHKLMDLLEEQEVSPTGYSSGYFDGYVSGIAEISVFTFWCPPDNVNLGQTARITANYLRAHPEYLHKDAYSLVVDALRAPFPCKNN